MVTAAGVAHANRLPVLLLPGDTFTCRAPDPVLQQVEHFGDPTTSVNDAFRAGLALLRPDHPPRAAALHASPGGARAHRPRRLRTGRAGAAPGRPGRGVRLPGGHVRHARAPRPAPASRPRRPRRRSGDAALRPQRPLLVARRRGPLLRGGGGGAGLRRDPRRARRRDRRRTDAGPARAPAATAARSASSAPPRPTSWPPRPTSCWRSAPGSRTSPRPPGPGSPPASGIVTVNAARFDAVKHSAQAVVGDARETLVELSAELSATGRRTPSWAADASSELADWDAHVDRLRAGVAPDGVADLRPGRGGRQRRQRTGGLRAHRLRRDAGRAARRMAHRHRQAGRVADLGRHDGPRVRLLLHGLRGGRSLGRRDGAGADPPRTAWSPASSATAPT